MQAREGEHPFGAYGQKIVVLFFFAGWAGDSFLLHFFLPSKPRIPWVVHGVLVVVLFGIASIFIIDGHRVFTQGNKAGNLITDGTFRFTRHPGYLGRLVLFLALSLLTMSMFSLILLVFIFFYYDFLARYEEKYLYLKFGERYLTYWKKTPKWLFFRKRLKTLGKSF